MVQKLKVTNPGHEETTNHTSILLMINYYFPPVKAVGAVRIGNFYKHARAYFGQIHVLTTSNQNIFQQEEETSTYEAIHPIPTLDFRRFLSFFQKNVTYFSSRKKKHPIKQFIIRLIDSFPFNLLIGDGGLLYTLAAYRKGVYLIKKEGITHIFSSFRPYSDHAVAYLLKRRFPHLYWIADFRDVQVDPNRKNVLFPRFQHWCNRQILQKADLLTSVSKGYTEYLGRYNDHTYCLRNGVEEPDQTIHNLDPFSTFTIAYTGTVYPQLQNPGILLQAIQELIAEGKIANQEIQLVLAGRDQEVWQEWLNQYQLGPILKDLGTLSRSKALEIQQQSHINLLLSWSSTELKGVLTGKLYEYLQAGHPILTIINGVRDPEFEDLFDQFQAGMIAYDRQEELDKVKHFVLKNFLEWKATGTVPSSLKKDQLQPFYWSNLMQQLMENEVFKA